MKTSTRTASRAATIALCTETLALLRGTGAARLGAWFTALRIVRTTPHRDVAIRFANAALAGEVYASVRRLEMGDALDYYAGVYRDADLRAADQRIAA
jgi:hypothetical protein